MFILKYNIDKRSLTSLPHEKVRKSLISYQFIILLFHCVQAEKSSKELMGVSVPSINDSNSFRSAATKVVCAIQLSAIRISLASLVPYAVRRFIYCFSVTTAVPAMYSLGQSPTFCPGCSFEIGLAITFEEVVSSLLRVE